MLSFVCADKGTHDDLSSCAFKPFDSKLAIIVLHISMELKDRRRLVRRICERKKLLVEAVDHRNSRAKDD